MSDLYDFDARLELTLLDPQFPADVCGNQTGYICKNAPQNQVVAVCFSKDADKLYVARLLGKVTSYTCTIVGSRMVFDDLQTVYDVEIATGKLREFGLTGMLCYENTYLFLAVTTVSGSQGVVRVDRVDVRDGSVKTIYERTGAELIANAHNLHMGCLFPGLDAIVVPFGDLNNASKYCNDPSTDFGKVLLMDFDGNTLDKSVFDTGYANNMHLAYGNRNMFTARVLQEGRFAWGENGNSAQRAVVYSLQAAGLSHNLQWTNGRDTPEWLNMVDPATGSQAVLYDGKDTVGIVVEPYSRDLQTLTNVPENSEVVLH